jgi:hypothetical protein
MTKEPELYEAWLSARAKYWAAPTVGDNDTLRERRNEAFEAAKQYREATGEWPIAPEVTKERRP